MCIRDRCIECETSFHKDGSPMPEVSKIYIDFYGLGPLLMKPHYKTNFNICFGEHRKNNDTIDCFGHGLSSYIQKKSGKKKVVSLGIRQGKFFYRLHNDFDGEYDKIVMVKDLDSGQVIMTREKRTLNPSFNGPKLVRYKLRLKLKK